MGEAKRRKQNDPNYGQPTILTLNPTDTNKFLTGLLDFTVAEAEDVLPTLAPETEESVKKLDEALKQHQSKMQVVLPIEHTENLARDYLVKNWSLAWDSLSKLRAVYKIIYRAFRKIREYFNSRCKNYQLRLQRAITSRQPRYIYIFRPTLFYSY